MQLPQDQVVSPTPMVTPNVQNMPNMETDVRPNPKFQKAGLMETANSMKQSGAFSSDVPNSSQPPSTLLDTVSKMNIVPKNGTIIPKAPEVKESPFMTAIRTFNRRVGRPIEGLMQTAYTLAGEDKSLDMLDSYVSRQDELQSSSAKINPTAAKVGESAGFLMNTVNSLTTTSAAASAVGLAAAGTGAAALGGAIIGAANYNDNPTKLSKAADIGVGAATGAVFQKVLSKAIDRVSKISKLWNKNPSDLIDDSIDYALGKGASKTSIGDANNTYNNMMKEVSSKKNELYALRDSYANDNNFMINKTNLQSYADDLVNRSSGMETPETDFANNIIKGYLKGGKSASFSAYQKGIEGINRDLQTAFNSGDKTKYYVLDQIKKSMQKDMSDAIENGIKEDMGSLVTKGISDSKWAQLQMYHDAAEGFYKNTYAPLSTMAGNASMADNFVNQNFTKTLFENLKSDPAVGKAFASAPKEIQQTLIQAHINGLKEAASNGENFFKAQTYANSIHNFLKTVNNSEQLKPMADRLNIIAEIADSVSAAKKGEFGKLAFYGMISGGMYGGKVADSSWIGVAAGLTPFFVTKLIFLNSAAKMLSSPAANALLKQYGLVGPSSIVGEAIGKQLATVYGAHQAASMNEWMRKS